MVEHSLNRNYSLPSAQLHNAPGVVQLVLNSSFVHTDTHDVHALVLLLYPAIASIIRRGGGGAWYVPTHTHRNALGFLTNLFLKCL